MKIIIAGAGKIGRTVAALLSQEGHDITIIEEKAETIAAISNELDVICVEGSATNPEVLQEAGAAQADLLMVATQHDEVNMVCGVSARHLGTRHVIARIRDPEYLNQTEFLREALGLSVIINPEYECAKEISRILRFPSAVRVDTFSKGSVELVEHRVAEGSKLDGLPLHQLQQRFDAKVLVGVVVREGETIIPNGDFILQGGDRLGITGDARELRRFFLASGQYVKPVRKAMLLGGGRIAVYLARLLAEVGISVTVVERDRATCDLICDMIPEALIVCGDGTRSDVLLEDGITAADAFVALTGEDGDNIITSMYAHRCGVSKIVAKVNREHFSEILENSGLDSIVSPKTMVAQQIVRYVRAMDNSMGSSMETLYHLADGSVEALEFRVGAEASCVGIPLKDLRLRPNILICALIRGRETLLPDGATVIQPGDHAVIVAAAGRLKNIDDMVEGLR